MVLRPQVREQHRAPKGRERSMPARNVKPHRREGAGRPREETFTATPPSAYDFSIKSADTRTIAATIF
jgi:hypothetical protein